jgi:tetratricopeptide (TPR) repeat protein
MRKFARLSILTFLYVIGANFPVRAQVQADPPGASKTAPTAPEGAKGQTYEEQKKFAVMLFQQNHHLEALPIFQDLAKRNPGDAEILFGYGACLIDHSATLKNEPAARAERLQARDLLLEAKQMGLNSGLLMNLLETLPADGSVRFPGRPEVVAAIQDGEAEFAKNNYPAAIQHYSKAIELDPNNYAAALFAGDSYFAAKDFVKAGEWYGKAIQINPDIETAYRYASDMYTKNGEQEKARKLAIQAVVAEPYNNLPWRGLAQWATTNHLKLALVRIDTHGEATSDGSANSTIRWDPNSSANGLVIWMMYNGTRQTWRKEEFKKHFPQETEYRHTLAEEVAALKEAAFMLPKDKPEAITGDPDLKLLKKLADAQMLEPYVLLSAPDRGIAIDYIGYREKNRKLLEEYLSQFVVPPAPAAAKP